MVKREEEILKKYSNILKEKRDFTLLEFDEEFLKQIQRDLPRYEEKEWYESLSEEEKLLASHLPKSIFYKRLSVYEDYVGKWEKGLWMPNEKDLEKLKDFQKVFEEKILSKFARLKEESPSLADQVEEEEKVSKKSKKTLDKLLKNDEYRQKAEELLRRENEKNGNGGNNSSSSQLSDTDKKIASLQARIKTLEDEVKQVPDSGSSQNKEEIQRQIQQLKNELKKKEKEKEKEKETSKDKNKKDNFPTGLVVGGGIVIFILLVVVIFLLGRNNKNK